jgi:hypothetical protein
VSVFNDEMGAEEFAVWLTGYLAGSPEAADDAIKAQLETVVGRIVKRKLLGGSSWILKPDEREAAKNWPLPPSYPSMPFNTGTPLPQPTWIATTADNTVSPSLCAVAIGGAQCDEEQRV